MTVNWNHETPCRNGDPEEWFAEDNQTNQWAQELCSGCPVLHACRDWALRRDEFGVWGGWTRRHRLHAQKRLGITPPREGAPQPRPPVKALELLAESERLRAEGLTLPKIAAQFGISGAYLREARDRARRHLAEVAP